MAQTDPHINTKHHPDTWKRISSMTKLHARLGASNEGFTLIELLIVIVILGILAGIAIFAVGQFRDDAKTACSNANNRINTTVTAARTINSGGTYTASSTGC